MAQTFTPAPIRSDINAGGPVAAGSIWALWFGLLYNLINVLQSGNFTSLTIANGPAITSGHGAPIGIASMGSLYLRTDTGELYVYQSAGWTGK